MMMNPVLHSFALILSEDDMRLIADELYKDEEKRVFSIYDAASDLDVSVISGFVGLSHPVDDKGNWKCYDAADYDCDDVFCILAEKASSPFVPVYSSVEDMIEELKATVCDYLPDDFDFRSNLRFIEGYRV